jgi:alpha-L-rhamnosidase
MVGRVRLRVKAPAGRIIRLRFAEVLNADGSLYTENLRAARCTDFYTAKGDPAGETWEPRFTFHGFRYVEIDGLLGDEMPVA